MAVVSGNDAFVKLGATTYAFRKWRLNFNAGVKIYHAFGSPAQKTTEGGYGGTITLEGPYDTGAMALVMGTLYTIHLGLTAALELIVAGRLADGELGAEMTPGGDPADIAVNFASDGVFAIAFTAPA